MFKLGSTLLALVLLTSCAQIFDNSLYKNVDSAPSLSASALASASVTQIHDLLKDPNIYTEFENNSSAAQAVGTNLTGVISSSSSSSSDKALAYRTQILINTYASTAGTVVNNDLAVFIPLLSSGSLSASGTPPTWIQSTAASLFAGMSQAQIETALLNFAAVDTLFKGLFTLTAPAPGNTSAFYGTDNNADLAQIGTLASLSVLLLDLCYSDPVRTADFILNATPADVDPTAFVSPSPFLTQLNNFTGAFTGTAPSSYTYYLQTLAAALKF
jgi:hypothetical protein